MAQAPYQALADLAAKSRRSARGLPEKVESAPRWRGLGFSLLGHNFVAPMGQVVEMMEVPSSTRLPGVEPWVIGLSNVRGRLLPLFDFAAFVGGHLGQQRRYHRVLVLETHDLFSGLVVERAMGMQYFEVSQFSGQLESEVPERLKPYLSGQYKDSEQNNWHVLDFLKLAADARFVNAALL